MQSIIQYITGTLNKETLDPDLHDMINNHAINIPDYFHSTECNNYKKTVKCSPYITIL